MSVGSVVMRVCESEHLWRVGVWMCLVRVQSPENPVGVGVDLPLAGRSGSLTLKDSSAGSNPSTSLSASSVP